jgi:hypothetical protein
MVDLFKTREARIAAAKAARGTPEWHAAGQALTAEREAAKAAADAAKAAAADAAKPVTERELQRAVKLVNAAVADAAADTGMEPDQVAWDVVENVTLDMRPALRAEVKRVLL